MKALLLLIAICLLSVSSFGQTYKITYHSNVTIHVAQVNKIVRLCKSLRHNGYIQQPTIKKGRYTTLTFIKHN